MMKPRRNDAGMMFRFSLYGFLKNQTYFEPFLILALREKGLSFFQIGMLIGFRDLCVNMLEIPSGAAADAYGRRRLMVLSFLSYIASFLLLAHAIRLPWLFAAMLCFAVGEAFRTGTHKAMIFDWLRSRGREDERTRVYGYTRSWSKLGSALAALIAAGLVVWRGRYSDVFLLCIVPYALNIVNFLGYPPETEGAHAGRGVGGVWKRVWDALKAAWTHPEQRRVLLESMGFEGGFSIAKDYLQPTLKMAALSLPVLAAWDDRQRTALLAGAVYAALNLGASAASRRAHRFVTRAGGEDRATQTLWAIAFGLYALMIPGHVFGVTAAAVAAFIGLHLAQNLWRPAIVSRLNACSDPALAATTLSLESQSKRVFGVVAAPLLGLAVDHAGLWPVGVLGAAVALAAVMRPVRR